ncbi:putative membrane protein YcfT [Kushneria sinocarnis]|uniref:Putative membrane protein YcfT n=1 Tax=Kushneria sinocarnis TaxID=595502 RepID=A0A420WV69_9GAMM|nr:acyltransferase [Kushneria sinocarnis]RKR02424.1 putative membrane protein YcfT [Kushneria sinocarnis]
MSSNATRVSSGRFEWMDALRGIAIVMVVYLHSADSMSIKFPELSPAFLQFNAIMTPFRMPALMFLSGLLVASSMAKGGQRYFRGKAINVLYPYVIWSLIGYVLYLLRAYYLDKPPVEFWSSLLLHPMMHLWFIYYILVYYVMAFFLLKTHRLLCLALVMGGYTAMYYFGFAKFGYYMVFFMVGGLLGARLDAFRRFIERAGWSLVLPVAVMCLWTWLVHEGVIETVYGYDLLQMAMAFIVITLLLKITMLARIIPLLRPFQWFGRNSLAMFLVHFPFTWAAPVIMTHFVDSNPDLVFPFYFATVLGVSAVLAWLNNRSRLVSLLFTANALMPAGARSKDSKAPARATG